MTDDQFQQIIEKLSEINDNIKLITAKDAGKEKYNLGDLYHEISFVKGAVEDVEKSVSNLSGKL